MAKISASKLWNVVANWFGVERATGKGEGWLKYSVAATADDDQAEEEAEFVWDIKAWHQLARVVRMLVKGASCDTS